MGGGPGPWYQGQQHRHHLGAYQRRSRRGLGIPAHPHPPPSVAAASPDLPARLPALGPTPHLNAERDPSRGHPRPHVLPPQTPKRSESPAGTRPRPFASVSSFIFTRQADGTPPNN